MRGPRDLSAADGHTPVTKYQWFVNIHVYTSFVYINLLYKTSVFVSDQSYNHGKHARD